MLSRRDLFHILPAGAAACLGCTAASMCAAQTALQTASAPRSDGFAEKADMTWQQVFDFSYKGYARLMKKLAARVGHDEFLAILQKASTENTLERMESLLQSAPARDLRVFEAWMKTQPIYGNALVYDVLEETDTAFEIHVSQCLWAKTFRAQNAADIGYASICYPDYASTTAFNPKIKLLRTKTLMQGDDCCNHRWVMET